jgi:anti-anti-sigma factor
MTVVHNQNTSPGRIVGILGHFTGDGVCLSTRWQGNATVIAVTGELDTCNLHHLSDYTRRHLTGQRPVVLDLSGLDFLAAQGIRILFEIDEQCGRYGLDWALVSGRPVNRLLRICDRNGRLPAAASIDEALQRFSPPRTRGAKQPPRTRGAEQRQPRALLQLVPKST